jgi:hypothetical protein
MTWGYTQEAEKLQKLITMNGKARARNFLLLAEERKLLYYKSFRVIRCTIDPWYRKISKIPNSKR